MRPLTANTRDLMMHDFRTKPDNLDPDDWQNFRSISHDALSLMIDFIETIRERPVWTQAPAAYWPDGMKPIATYDRWRNLKTAPASMAST